MPRCQRSWRAGRRGEKTAFRTDMDIQITTKKSEGVERLIEVSVPARRPCDAEEEKTARRYATQRSPARASVRARRRRRWCSKRFKDAIRQQVLETLVQEAFKEVMEREKLDVAAQPHVHDLKFEEGEPLTFELHLEVRPKLELDAHAKASASRAPRRR